MPQMETSLVRQLPPRPFEMQGAPRLANGAIGQSRRQAR